MARRRRRSSKRRSFRGVTSLNLGKFVPPNPLGKSVDSTDILVGAAVGIVGGRAVVAAVNKLGWAPKMGSFYANNSQILGALSAGLIAYVVQRKKDQRRGLGHLIGAGIAGLAPVIHSVADKIPGLHGVTELNLSDWAGLIVNDPNQLNGLIVDDQNKLAGANLAAYAMEDEGIDGFAELMTEDEESVY